MKQITVVAIKFVIRSKTNMNVLVKQDLYYEMIKELVRKVS